jgi:hypothetical protein
MNVSSPIEEKPDALGRCPAVEGSQCPPRRGKRWLLGIAGLVVLAGGVAWALPQIRYHEVLRRLNDPDRKVRLAACFELGSMPVPAGIPHLQRLLLEDSDREMVEAAGLGLSKTKDRGSLPVLRKAVERGPDDVFLAKLFQYLARLGGDGEAAFLRTHAGSPEPWRAIGAASGLLEANDVSGGNVLLHYMESGTPDQKVFAADALLTYAGPMMDMIGQGMDLDVSSGMPLRDEQVAAVKRWWLQPSTGRLLNDYISWHRRPNPEWRQIGRLLHARDRAARRLGMEKQLK